MAMSTKASGLMTRLMEKELILMPMGLTTMETGSTINNMATAWNRGQMVPSTKATTSMARRKEKVSLPLLMAVSMKVSLNRTKSVDTENIHGLMENNMKESGVTTKCTAKAHSFGKTKRSTKDNLSTINVKVMELSAGLMDANM